MNNKINRLTDALENEKFRVFSPFMFEKPRSVTELEKMTKVSRTTIYKFLNALGNDYIKIVGEVGRKDKMYLLKTDFIKDVLKEQLELTAEESFELASLLKEDAIEKYLRRFAPVGWDMIINSIGITFLTIDLMKPKWDLKKSKMLRVSGLYDPLTEDEAEEYQKAIWYRINNCDKTALDSLNKKIMSSDKIKICFNASSIRELIARLGMLLLKSR